MGSDHDLFAKNRAFFNAQSQKWAIDGHESANPNGAFADSAGAIGVSGRLP